MADIIKFKDKSTVQSSPEIREQWMFCSCSDNTDGAVGYLAPVVIPYDSGPVITGLVCMQCQSHYEVVNGVVTPSRS